MYLYISPSGLKNARDKKYSAFKPDPAVPLVSLKNNQSGAERTVGP